METRNRDQREKRKEENRVQLGEFLSFHPVRKISNISKIKDTHNRESRDCHTQKHNSIQVHQGNPTKKVLAIKKGEQENTDTEKK